MSDLPYRRTNQNGSAPMIIICDHASNRVPAAYGDLGLSKAAFERHIAWDIGAAAIAEILARRFDAPAILSDVSRLLIDCNRNFADPGLAPRVSDGTEVPANRNLSEAEREARWHAFHQPYHQAVADAIERKLAGGQDPVLLSIHSMTPSLRAVARPWQIAVCWAGDRRLSAPMLAALRARPGIVVGDNEPYLLDLNEDYSVPIHALRRGLKHLQIEFRQDEVADRAGQQRWADLFGDCLEEVLALSQMSSRP
ncbi:MAG TPA: N-formylglutamate amidohydrolase [Dongiaceae bacterium]|jgi:predicted N-formylglutamate amidohydrolase|nr:N-formylglutamate amidohydrolase [Dongiaceae bacterium]